MTLEIHEKSPYICLTNESMYPFKTQDGLSFRSISHAYYYYMYDGDEYTRKLILSTKSLDQIKSLIGFERFGNLCKPSRHISKYSIDGTVGLMRTLLLLKLNTHPDCVNALLSTWGKHLVVTSGSDNVLGIGRARMGINLTGNLLMELRKDFQKIRHEEYINSLITDYKIIDSSYSTVCDDPHV